MAATVKVTGSNPVELSKKQKALQFMNDNLSVQEISRLEEMSKSDKARAMLNENWSMLKTMI